MQLGAFDYRDGYGNCPPGMYRPAPMYDCRPNVGGATQHQLDLSRIAAQYVDDGSTAGQTTTGAGPVSTPYQAPAFVAPVQVSGGSGNNTMLLILGALALFLVMKK